MAKTNTIIKIGLYDVTAKKDLTTSANEQQPFVDLNQLSLDVININKYATIEQNRFLLDDTFNLFPDNPQDKLMGYWSNTMSDSNGVFQSKPKLTFSFGENHSSIGLTFDTVANGDFDYNATITWYNASNQIIKTGQYDILTGLYVLYEKVDNYRKIEVEFNTTSKPYRWIKLDLIAFGVLLSYEKNQILSAKIKEELNPLSFVVPTDSISFRLFSKDKDFSLANPKGIYTALQQSQSVTVSGVIDGNNVQMGHFYLEDWEQESEEISKFTAYDSANLLDKTIFKNGRVYVNETAEAIIEEILTDAQFLNYEIADDVKNIQLSGWIKTCTHREALQQVAFACGCAVETSRSNLLEFFKTSTTVSSTITKSKKFIGSKSKQKPFVTDVQIESKNYTLKSTTEELYKQTLAPGEYEINYGFPAANATITGGIITKNATNYAILEVAAQGEVVITGNKYDENKILVQQKQTNLPAGTVNNSVSINNSTLVNVDRAKILAPIIIDYFNKRRIDEFKFVAIDQKVSDYVRVESIGDLNLLGTIEQLEIDLVGGYVGSAKVIGETEVI